MLKLKYIYIANFVQVYLIGLSIGLRVPHAPIKRLGFEELLNMDTKHKSKIY